MVKHSLMWEEQVKETNLEELDQLLPTRQEKTSQTFPRRSSAETLVIKVSGSLTVSF